MENIKYNSIICRYTEIATKKGNRNLFEAQMIKNICTLLKKIKDIQVQKIRGRIFVKKMSCRENAYFESSEMEFIVSVLAKYALGLESVSPAIICRPDINEIRAIVKNTLPQMFDRFLSKNSYVTFRVRARRSHKQFSLNSKEVELSIADCVSEIYGAMPHKEGEAPYIDRIKVNLEEADITIGCEIRSEFAFIYYESVKAPGGLPVGSGSPVISLLSGGIDSPVASYLVMRRGCPVNFMTFHSAPYTPKETQDKISELAKLLNKFQPGNEGGKVFSCNLSEFQKAVRDLCKDRFRTILYRRMMMRIASKIAEKHNFKAIVTGESLGQVASQTIENITTIGNAVTDMIIRPLITTDKHDTIKIAKHIGSFDISKRQVPDSCTVFAPRSPATKTYEQQLEQEERKISDYNDILLNLVENTELIMP